MEVIYILIFTLFMIAFAIAMLTIVFMYNYELLLTKVSQEIADGYIIFTNNGKITDYNNVFLKLFEFKSKDLKNKSIFKVFSKSIFKENEFITILKDSCKKAMLLNKKVTFDIYVKEINKNLHFEIMNITSNNIFAKYVIIVKDVTKTYEIINELYEKQEMMANREKFVTLGQLVSGIVHSLKSPIFSIAGQLEQIENLISEYETSIDDEQVTVKDHYEIAEDMNECLEKIKIQTEGISNLITAIRSQVITLNNSNDENIFTVDELLKYIDILTKNTLKQYLIVLNFIVKINKETKITGNINALVYVINNLIMNSIDSYDGKPNQTIDIIVEENKNNLEISVIDTGKGIPKSIQNKIFKEIIPTNSNTKTGLRIIYIILQN